MLRTIDRYVIREILPPLLLSLLIFTFILEIPPLMQQLESLVAKGVPWSTAGEMLLTLIPQALGLTIPMALLVGLLIGLGRLSGDREIVALLACGVSPYRLLRPVLLLALVATGATFYVMTQAIPDANQRFREITYDIVSKRVENDVRPQVFFEDFPNWVLYTRDVPKSRDGWSWRDVLVADTHKPEETVLYLARRGRLNLDKEKQTVELVLDDGVQYRNTGSGGKQQVETFRFAGELRVTLDPQSVFPRMELQRGLNELRISDLQAQAADKIRHGISPHLEIMAIQQKYSFAVACLVFAVIGLALGVTVARDGKLAGFVIGIAVIFAYYVMLYLSEGLTKGHYIEAHLSRWVPNLVLFPFGVVALIWRARWAEGRLPLQLTQRIGTSITAFANRRQQRSSAAPLRTPGAPGRRRGRVVLVIRVPRFSWVAPSILDRYVSWIYLKTAGLSFVALLGIFYISTFLDKSDKLFKGQASGSIVLQLLVYQTPQFIYYVIPIAALLSVLVTFGLLSRTSELSVMKACGISIYRVAAPLFVLSLVWSSAIFGLEQQFMARANREAESLDAEIRGRPQRTFNMLNRAWLVGHNGDIYHYSYYDPQHDTLKNLSIYRPDLTRWQLASETFVASVAYQDGQWQAVKGWQQNFAPRPPQPTWEAFARRALPLETPDYFKTEQPVADLMTVAQLKSYIDDLAATGLNVVPQSVDLQKKLAFPFVTVVMTLLAVPFGMSAGNRGTLYGIGIGIVIALSYWIAMSAFSAVGRAGMLSPILAGWAPNVMVAGAAAYLLLTART